METTLNSIVVSIAINVGSSREHLAKVLTRCTSGEIYKPGERYCVLIEREQSINSVPQPVKPWFIDTLTSKQYNANKTTH